MTTPSKNEFYLTLRSVIFFAAIIILFYIYRTTVAPEIGQVIVRLPNECAKTINVKGKEFVNYSCFRNLTTAKIEKEIEL